MVWFVVDDVLPFHERVIRAGNAAIGLWVRGGAWCSGQLTDGFIPKDVARTMGSPAEIRRLVDVGLWHAETLDGQDGYRFHAWAEDGTGMKRQQTKAEVEEKRRKEREKKARQRSVQQHDATGRFLPMSPGDTPGDTPRDSPGVSHRSTPYQANNPSPLRSEGGAPPVDNPGESNPHSAERPSPFCARHPAGTDGACRACGNARRRHDTWTPPAAPPRAPRWDPETHCEHGQHLGACDACEQEAIEAARVIRGHFGGAA